MTHTDHQSRSAFRRKLPIITGSVLAAGVLLGAVALSPALTASTTDAFDPPTATQPDSKGGALIYSAGEYSVQPAVNNGTGHTMKWDTGTASGGHWNERLSISITDQSGNIMTAYTDQPSGFTWNLVQAMDNGDHACVELNSGQTGNSDPHDISGYIAKNLDATGQCGDPDPAYENSVTESNTDGAHSWVTFTFGAASS